MIAQLLAKHGPYTGLFQLAYFDSASKIKTSSIVSYGLRPLVKFDGTDSLFFAWKHADKNRLKAREKKSTKGDGHEDDSELLEKYIDFCVKSLNDFFIAAKLGYGPSHWDVEHEKPSELLRPTSINGLIACLRRAIEHGMPLSLEAHKKRMVSFHHSNSVHTNPADGMHLGKRYLKSIIRRPYPKFDDVYDVLHRHLIDQGHLCHEKEDRGS